MAPSDPKPKAKPKSLAEFPKRWDSLAYRKADGADRGVGPARLLVAFIVMLCLFMLGGVLLVWKAGPSSAAAAPGSGSSAPAHQAIAAVLESARALQTGSQWAKAETILRQAAMQFPEDQEIRIALAETLLAMKRPADAYDQYEKALAIGPRDAKLEFAAGQIASTAGLTDRAETHFAMAQTADPRNASYALMLGLTQRKQGGVEAAKASLLRAVNLDPESAYAWGALADISLAENNVNLCLQHIDRARKLQPESKEWRLIEARAMKRKGEPEKALMILTPLDRSQKREPQVVRLIAECFGMLNRHGDAAEAYGDASLAEPTSPELAYEAAAAYERAGNIAKALEFGKRSKLLGSEPGAKLMERLGQ
jgi:predicted Zn-dependent protease